MARKPKVMPVQPPVWYPRGDIYRKAPKETVEPDVLRGIISQRGKAPTPQRGKPSRPTPPPSPYGEPKTKTKPKPKTKGKPKTGNKRGGSKNKSSVMTPSGVWSILGK